MSIIQDKSRLRNHLQIKIMCQYIQNMGFSPLILVNVFCVVFDIDHSLRSSVHLRLGLPLDLFPSTRPSMRSFDTPLIMENS